jgi:formamidopyrimidine-DNA glycosylase
MPELPEVETLRRELDNALKGKKIKSAQVLWPKTVAPLSVAEFHKQITNQTIDSVKRQAKILIIDFRGPLALAFHLKMTGQLIFHPIKGHNLIGGHPAPEDEKELPNKHTRLVIYFADGSILYFNDLRKFGWARLINDTQLTDLTKNIGVEPLSKLFTEAFLIGIFKKYPKRTVKQILMDQSIIAGIGNIYADESAFLAKVLPTRLATTLDPEQIKLLRSKIIEVLKKSLKFKGTSSRNYRRSNGELGGFVPHLFVYGREGKPCKVCGTPIKKIKHNGRGTHFCPNCQK